MNIPSRRRPWDRSQRRYNPDPWYQTGRWKRIRERHIRGYTRLEDGRICDNKYCINCFKTKRIHVPMHTVDHIHPIKQGGNREDPKNLQSLCEHCNAVKTALDLQNLKKQ